MNDFLEIGCVCVIGLLGLLVAILGIGFLGSYAFSRPSCYAHWQNSEYQVRWSLFGDCQISKDGKVWLPDDFYREVKVRHD